MYHSHPGMLKRNDQNPLLTVSDLPCEAYYILNPGVAKYQEQYLLLVDVFHIEGGIIFWLARSSNGVDFTFDPEPINWPESYDWWEENGVYDPRITQIDNEYFIMYGSHNNEQGTRLGIVKTTDFEHYERVAIASEVGNRNGIMFPEKIGGRYCRFERPFMDEDKPCNMWMSYSEDMHYWGDARIVMYSRPAHWDDFKLGGGAVPIRVNKGWLSIYHGVHRTCDGAIYSLFAAIHDADDPSQVIARSKYPILFPNAPYEKAGRVSNVVFTCGALLEDDGMVKVYYGAADACIGMAEAKLEDIIASCYQDYDFMMYNKNRFKTMPLPTQEDEYKEQLQVNI